MAQCKGICRGAVNTAKGLHSKQGKAELLIKCPIGCVVSPNTEKGVKNFYANNGKLYQVCRNNPWR